MAYSQAVLTGPAQPNPESARAVRDRMQARDAIGMNQCDLGTDNPDALLVLDNAADNDLSGRGRRSTKQADEQDLAKRQAPDLQRNVPVAFKG